MRNGKGSLRRPMAIEPQKFADNFARTIGTTTGTLKERRTSERSAESDPAPQGGGADADRGADSPGEASHA
jgi:hypothetical protein